MTEVRHDWTKEEISEIYHTPLLDLIYRAATVHRENHNHAEVQISSLISVKTGGCPEDCAYCPQAARYQTGVNVHAILPKEEVVAAAQKAKAGGASRLCMGAAWREVRDNRDFDKVIEMVKAVNELDMEVCCTLGMLNEHQAQRLADAGLYAYNHNLDTSEEDYKRIITTRTYDERLQTLENVRKAKITVCSGGIIGLGETVEDRISMLKTLSNLPKHPESVPVNALVPVQGTPLADQPRVSVWDMVRMISTARIIMPKTAVRLSAGRTEMSMVEQALCFMAGASSIFAGEKLLTTPNPDFDTDMAMFELLGLKPKAAFKDGRPNQKAAVQEVVAEI
ncbi:biotin synthase BioB [Mucilaginibacter sp. Bleaf8]|uniref:biotin synthase BioB n=1 Tax=Mucilaginibacter sp. Bleaf8 TaxID=2834430 RepID=UPI001BCBE761|nr:biotin synthase BioB [Mucilaginibacter sp. Bleaf8]MBS7563124.1 biotin synthase BioB [Mucilaginibacter sp. Bleaf8]